MESDKKRISKWRAEQQRRRSELKKQTANRSFKSLFAIDDDELIDPPELQEYLVRQNLARGNLARRMSSGEIRIALSTWNLDELNQLWNMRQEKLTYIEDAALLLSHIRHDSGIDPHLRPAGEMLRHEAIQALRGVLEENSSLAVKDAAPLEVQAEVGGGKRVEQVLRVIREGQAAFRKRLIDHYGAACMVTGTTQAEVIDAAHIIPYGGASTNNLCNGLLLRKDIHALFDGGWLAIGPDLVVYLDPIVEDPFYRSLDGKDLVLTATPMMSKRALRQRLSGDVPFELESNSAR